MDGSMGDLTRKFRELGSHSRVMSRSPLAAAPEDRAEGFDRTWRRGWELPTDRFRLSSDGREIVGFLLGNSLGKSWWRSTPRSSLAWVEHPHSAVLKPRSSF